MQGDPLLLHQEDKQSEYGGYGVDTVDLELEVDEMEMVEGWLPEENDTVVGMQIAAKAKASLATWQGSKRTSRV